MRRAGCADFVPSNLDPGSQFAVPMFECFDEVLRKASSWVRHQRRVRITNVQSIDYKLKHDYGTHKLYNVPIHISLRVVHTKFCLQCFDAVGWAAGRASGLQEAQLSPRDRAMRRVN